MTETTTVPAETPARRAVRRRSEFVAAFVEHAGAVPASERATVSLSTLITTTAMVFALTIVVGVFWGLISPVKKKTTTTQQYVAVAGWGCTNTTTQGLDVVGRTDEWRTVSTGGWAADGCRGQFQTFPMTGKAGTDDPGRYVQWWFRPTMGSQCRVDLYLPKGASPADTGADAAHYAVTEGRDGETYAEFVVDQARYAGQWHNAGAFPIRGGEFAIRLTNRGVPPKPGYRLAVSAMKVTCSV